MKPIPATIKIDGVIYSVTTGPDGRQILKRCEKAAEAKLDLCTRLKRRANSNKPRIASRAKAQQHQNLSRSTPRQE